MHKKSTTNNAATRLTTSFCPSTPFLQIGNHGPDVNLQYTNFWDTEMANRGNFFLSWNAGAARLLVPDSQRFRVNEMLSGEVAVVTRGAWPDGGKSDALEIMFDDNSEAPFVLFVSPQQCSQMLPDSDIGKNYPFTIWSRQEKLGVLPGKYRRAKQIPLLTPWVA